MNSKNYYLIAFFIHLCITLATAQTRFEIGAGGLAQNYFGDFAPKNVVSSETHLGISGYLKYNFNPRFALRLYYTNAQISGDYQNFADGTEQRMLKFNFQNRVKTYISIIEWEPLYKYRLGKKNFLPGLSPILSVGHGLALHRPETHFNEENAALTPLLRENILKDQSEREISPTLLLHFGVGTKLYLSKNILLTFEVAAQPTFSDFLDGVSNAANPKRKDWLVGASLTLGYSFTAKVKDADRDGVPDHEDECPNEKGKKKNRGCPDFEKLPTNADRDGDGVPDAVDKCPDVKGSIMNNGCPRN